MREKKKNPPTIAIHVRISWKKGREARKEFLCDKIEFMDI